MRRLLGPILVGVGAFALVMAALLKFYVYPSLAVAPADQASVSTSSGEQMTYFDVGTRTEKTADLVTTVRVVGDVDASDDADGDTIVWDRSTTTTTADGDMLSVETLRSAFDAHTGEAVDCCDTHIDDEPVTFEGLTFKFPFNTQKQEYDWYDGSLRESVPFQYDGTEEIEGVTTYRFTQTVEPTKIGELNVPSSVVGLAPGEMVTGERWYATERVYWVEPETGAMVKVQESPDETLRYEGEDVITLTQGTTGYDDETIKENADQYSSDGSRLHLVRVTAPLVLLIVGVVGLAAGIAVILLGRRRQTPGAHEARPLSHSGV